MEENIIQGSKHIFFIGIKKLKGCTNIKKETNYIIAK